MVRAKVYCQAIYSKHPGQAPNTVEFQCVYEPDASNDTENARFTKATPWGSIEMGIDNPDALAQFVVGEWYYVDFHPV